MDSPPKGGLFFCSIDPVDLNSKLVANKSNKMSDGDVRIGRNQKARLAKE
jgi:hypothetical protein